MEIKELTYLLEYPNKLHSVISEMRSRADLSEEEQGFILLYDHFNGDAEQIRTYLRATKTKILPKEKPSLRISLVRAAAVVIVLLASGLLVLLNRNEKAATKQAKSAQPETFREPGIPIFMGEEHEIDWAPLMFALDKETPQRALSEWKKIERIAPENDTLIYFGGIVYQKLNTLEKARSLFQINANSNSIFADRSAYFLLQIAKSEGNKDEAKKLMERLKNTQDLDLKPFVLAEQRTKNKEQ